LPGEVEVARVMRFCREFSMLIGLAMIVVAPLRATRREVKVTMMTSVGIRR
jgi:hypothetical protein